MTVFDKQIQLRTGPRSPTRRSDQGAPQALGLGLLPQPHGFKRLTFGRVLPDAADPAVAECQDPGLLAFREGAWPPLPRPPQRSGTTTSLPAWMYSRGRYQVRSTTSSKPSESRRNPS